MRFLLEAVFISLISTPAAAAAAARELSDGGRDSPPSGTTTTSIGGLRGGAPSSSSTNNDVSSDEARKLFPMIQYAYDDAARSGLDRSLAYIHVESELNTPLYSEGGFDAIANYIAEHSFDGNDDMSGVCPFDDYHEEEDNALEDVLQDALEGLRGRNAPDGRSLQMDHGGGGHSAMHFVESMCNMMIDSAPCVDWSSWINGTDLATEEVKIPCGECVTLDASPGQTMHGSSLEFGLGLNVVGRLVIPHDADVSISTKYVYVQGRLDMPAPAAGSSSGISSVDSGNRVKITLYGTDELTFTADDATDNVHLGPKGVGAKAFVIAGGKLDVRAMDETCPSWVKLQSAQYGVPFPNVSTNKTATQISTYHSAVNQAMKALDGNENSFTHTECGDLRPWWEVDLEVEHNIGSVRIVNRLDCCGGRLHDFDIWFLDDSKNVVDSIYNPGPMGNRKTFDANYVIARYVKIQLRDTDCLQLGEVEIYGWSASDPLPTESLDVLTLGDDAARCWSAPGSRLMLTSDTYSWDDAHTAVVADVPQTDPGKVYVMPLAKKKTAVDETFGYPDFAVEVALIDRSLVIEGAQGSGEFSTLGGHVIVLHTSHVQQHLEGALLQNMGQQGNLGRYPLHFHMSESVHGSTLAKNVIYKSNQRCIVLHGTHNVTVSENVAYDTKGHCFMLEDGGEWDNQFLYNLGAKTAPPAVLIRNGETDNFPSTFWITNPASHWIGNVAAGSQGPGFWFELKLRAPSSQLEINQGVNPKHLSLGTFDDNTAHSNNQRGGITTYRSGYRAPPGTTWNNIKAFKNKGSGLFQHGTNNIILKGGLLADNREAARNFHHEWAVYDGVEVIGRSEHVQSMIDQGRLSDSGCLQAGGISIQPNEGLGLGTTIKNSVFSGFDLACSNTKHSGIYVENDQVRNAVFDSAPTFTNNTFGTSDRPIDACRSINNSADGWVRYIHIEDPDGSMSRSGPGFYVQDEPPILNFLDSGSCQAVDGCLRFCPGACLRTGIVSISQDLTTRGFKMIIHDGSLSATVLRGPIWFDEKQNHISAQMPIALPAPTSGSYSITFTDGNDQPAWPGYTKINLDREPACSGALARTSQVDFVMPVPDDRCEDLFRYDDYEAGIHGWQNFFSGLRVAEEGGSYVISTLRRKDDRGHVHLSRTLDASCIAQLGGRSYTLFGKIRMTDANGNYVATDGTSDLSPRVIVKVDGLTSWNWRIATSADGSWADFSQNIVLPIDSTSAWRAQIIIDRAEKREFHITDWGMTLTPSAAPTTSPTDSPTLSPTTPFPTVSPTTAAPVTGTPTSQPVTSSPVMGTPTNLALNGFASAQTECYSGWARKAIDGNYNTINHSCCGRAGPWLMVDLGKDTVNYIDHIFIKNRINCCGGRLKRFYVEVLDSEKNVVWGEYHWGDVGNGGERTFTINDGTTGRFVRLRLQDTLTDCLHVGELEVWGYPIETPANPPEIYEMALGRPASMSSLMGSNGANRGNDGNFDNMFHTQCGAHPWWKVDLGVESFVQDVWITNRKDCCGGRLRGAKVEILDSDENVIQSKEIVGSVGNGGLVQKVFNEDTSFGRYVRVSMSRNDCLHFAEIEINGYHTMALPTTSPTIAPPPTKINLSRWKTATQSSTYNDSVGPEKALDGNVNSITHTQCDAAQPWWEVDLALTYTIASVYIVNRLDCCGGRLHDFDIRFLDEAGNEVDSIYAQGQMGRNKLFHVDSVNARYVKIQLRDTDCLQLGSVEVWGW